MTIRQAVALGPGLEKLDWADIPALVELEEILFPGDSPWTREMFWGELSAGNHYVVHRDDAGEIDGYAGSAVIGIEAEMRTIGVRPDRAGPSDWAGSCCGS